MISKKPKEIKDEDRFSSTNASSTRGSVTNKHKLEPYVSPFESLIPANFGEQVQPQSHLAKKLQKKGSFHTKTNLALKEAKKVVDEEDPEKIEKKRKLNEETEALKVQKEKSMNIEKESTIGGLSGLFAKKPEEGGTNGKVSASAGLFSLFPKTTDKKSTKKEPEDNSHSILNRLFNI